jgi:hypothetical protein
MNNVYGNQSKEMELDNLLTPEFPEVRIWFRYDHPDFEQKFHRDCPDAGEDSWHVEMCHSFLFFVNAIHSLASEEETYWCHCRRGLFLPNSCPDALYVNMENIVCGSYPLFITDIHGKNR